MDIVKSVFTLIFGLILFAGILYLAYISTKFIGKRYMLNGKGGRNLKILETVSVGRDMTMAIARAGERIFLIGITPDRINLISELKEDDLLSPYSDEEQGTPTIKRGSISFADALKYNINKKLGKDTDINDYIKKDDTTPDAEESDND
ncbi:MAG: flagellar biosynthetic protein FliO [Ruminococcus sp.]|nr:flagellar biosynthetic protein FliO [Ruminococcus sp.]